MNGQQRVGHFVSALDDKIDYLRLICALVLSLLALQCRLIEIEIDALQPEMAGGRNDSH